MRRRSNETVAERAGLNLGKHPSKQPVARVLRTLSTDDLDQLTVEVEGRKQLQPGVLASILAVVLSSIAIAGSFDAALSTGASGALATGMFLLLALWLMVAYGLVLFSDPSHVWRTWVSTLSVERERRRREAEEVRRRRRWWPFGK